MLLFLALLSAIGCAIFNGCASILEKIGATKHVKATSLHPGLLWKLRSDLPFASGIVLDLFAWVFTLYAVHNLPLFIVQPIIACSVIVTVLIEYRILKRHVPLRFIAAVATILIGLILLALVSTPEKSVIIDSHIKWAIVFGPAALLVVGSVFSAIDKHYSTIILAGFSGLAFGGVSIAGRAIIFARPYQHVLSSPLLWSIVAYGLLGILFFTLALQRAAASIVSAVMIAFETLLPIFVGLAFLGDHPKNNSWVVVYVGIVLALTGTMLIATGSIKPSKLVHELDT